MKKFYIVVDGSLPPGDQLAQAVHATTDYVALAKQPSFDDWHTTSNTVVCLYVQNTNHLARLREQLSLDNIDHTPFFEPDWPGQPLTAVAFIADAGYPVRKSRLAPRLPNDSK